MKKFLLLVVAAASLTLSSCERVVVDVLYDATECMNGAICSTLRPMQISWYLSGWRDTSIIRWLRIASRDMPPWRLIRPTSTITGVLSVVIITVRV